jgi:antitoxin component YwqK of YwqJK toxin-antitoxin module
MESPLQLKKRKNGREEDELFYLDPGGKLHGLWRCYYPGGKLKEECNYKHGIFHGLMRSWYPGEKIAFTGEFLDGKPVGTHQEWFPNGTLKHRCEYNDGGLKDGEEFYWRPDGLEESYCKYVNGKRVGRGYYNWPNGRLAMEYFYDNGTEKYYPQNRN